MSPNADKARLKLLTAYLKKTGVGAVFHTAIGHITVTGIMTNALQTTYVSSFEVYNKFGNGITKEAIATDDEFIRMLAYHRALTEPEQMALEERLYNER